MKKLLPVLVFLAAGCVSTPSGRGESPREYSPAEREAMEAVREAFDRLRRALVDGNAEAAYAMLSTQGLSDWLLERTRDESDGGFPKRVAALRGTLKVDFEYWLKANRRIQVPFVTDRSYLLPESVLMSGWLRDTWRQSFESEKAEQSAYARKLEVLEIYPEGTAASVFVKVGSTPALIYSMVLEGGAWRFDYDVKPAGTRR